MPLVAFLKARTEHNGLLAWQDQAAAAAGFALELAEVEQIALGQGILPARYQQNRNSISVQDQLRLFRASVAIIGCGGLGCHIIEQLARLGVGRLVVVDPDLFEEHNLNRQLFACLETIGQAKVAAARERVRLVNPAVTVTGLQTAFGRTNGRELLQGVQIVADALDNGGIKRELAELCDALRLPLVHGAIAGWYGQVATQFPGERTVQTLYRTVTADTQRATEQGNLSFTAAAIASLQVAEICKIILKPERLLRGSWLCADLLEMEFREISVTAPLVDDP